MDSTRRLTQIRNQKGFAIVYVALLISVLFGFLGLAVDVGHLYVVRGKLQNAADAAALAGAWSLYRKIPPTPGEIPSLDWERARTAATNFIAENNSDLASSVPLVNGTIEVGYWPPLNPGDPLSTVLTSPSQVPAVRATISRSDGNNGGPVSTFFMKILDSTKVSVPVSSRPAVAVSGFPGSVSPSILFPMALSKCMTDDIFSRPPAEWPNPININSPYGPGGADCFSGQWTSFKLDSNAVPTIRDLMLNGNPDPLATGDDIWIQPGAEATLYQTNKWTPPLPAGGMDVVMAIVDTQSTDLKTKGEREITGFATFHIDGTNATGADKYVFGHFISFSATYPTGISPGGPASNIVTPPQMVQ